MDQEKSCLFGVNPSGERTEASAILPHSVICFLGAVPWSGKGSRNRRSYASKKATELASALGLWENSSNAVLTYASPEEINVEDSQTFIERSADLAQYQQEFVDKFWGWHRCYV